MSEFESLPALLPDFLLITVLKNPPKYLRIQSYPLISVVTHVVVYKYIIIYIVLY